MQTLQKRGGSGLVTIPKDDLERDGLVDDDGEPADVHLSVERLGERVWVVRVCDGSIPELRECEEVKRIAAERVLDEDVYGEQQDDE
ncbi:hypothetical protein ACFQL1_15015 [Halomicroarcula sp. GCM10025709]|uniref:hypothetical protein n=1 Tax=Haloarcula TaxID=2237 RepID=UPI0024C3346C|nr:hypothetical protein [Halomicroarcula sp. YJ-61-S]